MKLRVLSDNPRVIRDPLPIITEWPNWDLMRSSIPGGLSRPYYATTDIAVLPDEWPDSEVQSFQRITATDVAVVELEDDEYQNIISRIDSRSFRLPLARQ